jgi:hypothetical protein
VTEGNVCNLGNGGFCFEGFEDRNKTRDNLPLQFKRSNCKRRYVMLSERCSKGS